jgi:hypothetical protein
LRACQLLLLWVCLCAPLALEWACAWAVSVHPDPPAAAVARLQPLLVQAKPFWQTLLLLLGPHQPAWLLPLCPVQPLLLVLPQALACLQNQAPPLPLSLLLLQEEGKEVLLQPHALLLPLLLPSLLLPPLLLPSQPLLFQLLLFLLLPSQPLPALQLLFQLLLCQLLPSLLLPSQPLPPLLLLALLLLRPLALLLLARLLPVLQLLALLLLQQPLLPRLLHPRQ